MGQISHEKARTTEVTRRAIQNSQESLRTLANRYINIKTASKWKRRQTASDAPMGTKGTNSTVIRSHEI